MNRFRIKRDVYSKEETLFNWTLTKKAPVDALAHINAEEKKALREEYKIRLNNEFKKIIDKKVVKELIEYTSEIEVENQLLRIELAKLHIFEAVDNLHQNKKDGEHSYFIRNALMNLLAKTGNRFPKIAHLFIEKYMSYKGSQGGKKRAENSIKAKFKKEIEQEFLVEKDRFLERSFKSTFCRRMHRKYNAELAMRTIEEYVTEFKRKYNISIK